jgi:predicted metal-binding membrane protein
LLSGSSIKQPVRRMFSVHALVMQRSFYLVAWTRFGLAALRTMWILEREDLHGVQLQWSCYVAYGDTFASDSPHRQTIVRRACCMRESFVKRGIKLCGSSLPFLSCMNHKYRTDPRGRHIARALTSINLSASINCMPALARHRQPKSCLRDLRRQV